MAALVSSCAKAGAFQWVGIDYVDLILPKLSTGSCKTLRILSKVGTLTGAVIGLPVSVTWVYLCWPSVEFIAIAFSSIFPSDCCISHVVF